MKYTNRNGKPYYLYAGTTKTGKPRYYFSGKNSGSGTPLEKLPEGYEIYERPENAQVFIRKQRPRLITEIEEQFVKKQLREQHQPGQYLVDCKDEYLTIYESSRVSDIGDHEVDMGHVEDRIKSILDKLKIEISPDVSLADEIPRIDMYRGANTAVLRFCLSDKDTRTFTVERFCFRGRIDDWIYVGGPDNFQGITSQYIKYLGSDKFYELPYL